MIYLAIVRKLDALSVTGCDATDVVDATVKMKSQFLGSNVDVYSMEQAAQLQLMLATTIFSIVHGAVSTQPLVPTPKPGRHD